MKFCGAENGTSYLAGRGGGCAAAANPEASVASATIAELNDGWRFIGNLPLLSVFAAVGPGQAFAS